MRVQCEYFKHDQHNDLVKYSNITTRLPFNIQNKIPTLIMLTLTEKYERYLQFQINEYVLSRFDTHTL